MEYMVNVVTEHQTIPVERILLPVVFTKEDRSVEVSSGNINESDIKVSSNEVILHHTDLKDANSAVPILLR